MNRRLLPYSRPGLAHLALAVALGTLGAVVTVVQWAALARIIDRAFLGGQGLAQLGGPFLLFLAAGAARSGLTWARELSAQIGATRITAVLRVRLLDHLMRLGPAWARGERTGALVAVATQGIDRLDPYFARFRPQVALSQIVPLLIAACILPRDWASAVLLLVTAPIIPILMILVGSYAEERINAQWTALSRLKAAFLDAIQGLPTTRALGQSALGSARVARQSEAFRVRTMRALRFAFLSGLVLEFITSVAIALVAVTLGLRLLAGGIAFEQAFLVLLLAPEFYRPLRELGTHYHAGMEGHSAAEQIFAILDQPAPEAVQHAPALPVPDPARPLAVTFRDVRYTYPGNDPPALDGVCLTFAPGTRTALVGQSGAGKSTLVNLLLGFLTPDCGRIDANGLSLAAFMPEDWRAQVALVPQRPHLFYGSVLDNIRFARPAASLEDVQRAAALAGAADFIAQLPGGYDSPLGENGTRLSKGQAQRIAIARAFLKDAPLLILDEPTAHLDPATEATIRAALERLAADRTTLLIAHRLSTVRSADQIVVLAHGRIAESGTHAELLALGGNYARLVRASDASADTLLPDALPAQGAQEVVLA